MADGRSGNRRRAAAGAGVVRWRGWRLPFVDYESWQRGRDLVFVLERDGDLALLPLTLSAQIMPVGQASEGEAASGALEALWELVDDGWRVTGRLHTAFVGFDAEDDFWRETFLRLGLPPGRRPRRLGE